MNTDILVVGGGVGGLRSAISASEEGASVTLVTKGIVGAGSETAYLDHLIELTVLAVSQNEQDNQLFEGDLLNYGHQINNNDLVKLLVEQSNKEYKYVTSIGVPMEKDSNTYPSHRSPRLVKGVGHFGQTLLSKLKNEAIKKGVNIIENATLYEVEQEGETKRAHIHLKGKGQPTEMQVVFSSLILATGGTGQMFSYSTNPSGSTGDGVGLALRLGAKVTNLEFLHFLPLLTSPIKGFYIISAVFTKGYLYNKDGEKYEPSLPENYNQMEPAEIQGHLLADACQWIQEQLLLGKGTEKNGVYWDGRHLEEMILNKMPKSYKKLKERGLDLLTEQAEVSIGCHQMLGGIQIDLDGRSTLPWLFAAGEVAGGFQGAERLMGTGVMEGLVFGERAGKAAASYANTHPVKSADLHSMNEVTESAFELELSSIKNDIRKTMDQILITKDGTRLQHALNEITKLHERMRSYNIFSLPLESRVEFSECQNMILLAGAFITASLNRKETRGSFIRTDYPSKEKDGKISIVQLKEAKDSLNYYVSIK